MNDTLAVLISKDAFILELTEDLRKFLYASGLVLGADALSRIVEVRGVSSSTLDQVILDPDRFDLMAYGELLLEYAENARLLSGPGAPNAQDAFDAFHVVASVVIETDGALQPLVDRVWRKVLARGRLDFIRSQKGLFPSELTSVRAEDSLSYADVANVCDMTPASVRNYTTENASDRLLTHRSKGRVYMDDDSLLDWITRRRGYRETTVVEVPAPENPRFTNLDELEAFLAARLRNVNPDLEVWGQAVNPEDPSAIWVFRSRLGNLEGIGEWSLETVIRVAKVLELTNTDFIRRAVGILLEGKLRAADLLPKGELVEFKRPDSKGPRP